MDQTTQFQLNQIENKNRIIALEKALLNDAERISRLRIDIKRLDLAMGAYKDLEERIISLEKTRIDTLPLKPSLWEKMFGKK